MKITKFRLKEIIKEELQQLVPETLTPKEKKKKKDLKRGKLTGPLNEAVRNFMPTNLAYIGMGLEGAIKLLMDGEGISELNKDKARKILVDFEIFKTLATEALAPESTEDTEEDLDEV